MSEEAATLASEGLLRSVHERARAALVTGALHPIATHEHYIEDGGVRFVVRVSANLSRKRRAVANAPIRSANPFLPPDPALLVGELSPTHVCVLNKFNVLVHHVLIVTRAYEDQEVLLTPADWRAMSVCLAEIAGLGFYNGGVAAGASQPHKHMQLVPLPLASSGPPVPVVPLLTGAHHDDRVCQLPGLPFRHAFVRLDAGAFAAADAGATMLDACYGALLTACGIGGRWDGGQRRQTAPYNLLLTRDWMLLVPRSRECRGSISVNALGFAGSLFVRDDDELAVLRNAGPMAVLTAVAVSE